MINGAKLLLHQLPLIQRGERERGSMDRGEVESKGEIAIKIVNIIMALKMGPLHPLCCLSALL